MIVTFQRGAILSNTPKRINGVEYVVVSTDSGTICFVLQTLDINNVMIIKPEDRGFEDLLEALGLSKNQTNVELLEA